MISVGRHIKSLIAREGLTQKEVLERLKELNPSNNYYKTNISNKLNDIGVITVVTAREFEVALRLKRGSLMMLIKPKEQYTNRENELIADIDYRERALIGARTSSWCF